MTAKFPTAAGSKRRGLTREQSLTARPEKLPTVSLVRQNEGKLAVRVKLTRSKWQRWLGGGEYVERTFVLDTFGQEVYECCDGKNKVSDIIKKFAKAHKVSDAESELAVTRFLQTLISKGVIAMAVKSKQAK